MLQTKAPQITRYDYGGMPEGPPYYQVIEGDLIKSPSPATYHQIIARPHLLPNPSLPGKQANRRSFYRTAGCVSD